MKFFLPARHCVSGKSAGDADDPPPGPADEREELLDSPDDAEDVDVDDLLVGVHGDPLDLAVGGPAGVVHDAPQLAASRLRGGNVAKRKCGTFNRRL